MHTNPMFRGRSKTRSRSCVAPCAGGIVNKPMPTTSFRTPWCGLSLIRISTSRAPICAPGYSPSCATSSLRAQRKPIALSRCCGSSPRPITAREATRARRGSVFRDAAEALRRLPNKQRLAVMLACVEGKSYEEVAEAMGLSVSAVRCHLARGRNRLRTAMELTPRSLFALRPAKPPFRRGWLPSSDSVPVLARPQRLGLTPLRSKFSKTSRVGAPIDSSASKDR